MNTLIPIPFRTQTVYALEHEGKPYVAMRPIVENLGLDWKSQHVKLTERFGRCVQKITTHDSIGRRQEMLCLPLGKLTGYLYAISENKVKPDLRDLIIAYQDECDEVLYRHWAAKHQAEHDAYGALLAGLFVRHPKWRGVIADRAEGLTQVQIGQRHGMNRRNVQRMLRRIDRAGLRQPALAGAGRRLGANAMLLFNPFKPSEHPFIRRKRAARFALQLKEAKRISGYLFAARISNWGFHKDAAVIGQERT